MDKDYYSLNGINVIQINSFLYESNKDKLLKIKGSLTKHFFVAYSTAICTFDIDDIEATHKENQCIATLIENGKRLAGALLEPEIFDYIENACSLEREALSRVGQDGELQIYK